MYLTSMNDFKPIDTWTNEDVNKLIASTGCGTELTYKSGYYKNLLLQKK